MTTTVKIKGDRVTISGLVLDVRPSKTLRESNGAKGNMLLVSTSEKLQVTLPDGRPITATLSLNLHCPPQLLQAPKAPEVRVTETGTVTETMDTETKRIMLTKLGFTEDQINEHLGHPMNPANKS